MRLSIINMFKILIDVLGKNIYKILIIPTFIYSIYTILFIIMFNYIKNSNILDYSSLTTLSDFHKIVSSNIDKMMFLLLFIIFIYKLVSTYILNIYIFNKIDNNKKIFKKVFNYKTFAGLILFLILVLFMGTILLFSIVFKSIIILYLVYILLNILLNYYSIILYSGVIRAIYQENGLLRSIAYVNKKIKLQNYFSVFVNKIIIVLLFTIVTNTFLSLGNIGLFLKLITDGLISITINSIIIKNYQIFDLLETNVRTK